MYKLKKLLNWEAALVLILFLEIAIFGSLNSNFLKPTVLLYSVNDYICISIISLFVTFVVITGGIDISVGSIVGLSSINIGMLWKKAGINIWATFPLVVLAGGLCGAFSGFLVAYTGVQAMVVTLGGMFLFSGLSLVLIGLSGTSAFEGIGGYPEEFIAIANGNIFGIPNPFLIFIALIIISFIILHKSRYGRYVFLVGVNSNAARYSGIDSRLITMSTYIFSGASASVAGIVLTSYLGSSRADLGAELTLPIVTAVVLGGTAITGGKGSIIGTALASIVVGILRFGLQMVGVSTQYIGVAVGLLLVFSVALRGISGQLNFRRLGDALKGK